MYEDAKYPMSSLYSAIKVQGTNVPATPKRQIIDWSCLKTWCEEGMSMLKEDKRRFLYCISAQTKLIDESVVNLLPHCDIRLNAGLIACLKKKRVLYSNQTNLLHLWAGILDIMDIEVEEVKSSYEIFSGKTHSAVKDLCSEEQTTVL